MSLSLSWKDINYSIRFKDNKSRAPKPCRKSVTREILKGVSGSVASGECLSIIGASGAGKTSLLNILSHKVQSGGNINLKGEIKLGGKSFSQRDFAKLSSFVMQDDNLLPALTVRETLLFAANMKMKTPPHEKVQRVDELIRIFKLTSCQHTLVGNALIKGVSGGERKRTSIAVEMVNHPKILVLDEPTSGLDSYTAFLVVMILKKYAQQGHIVMYTIHQPSSEIFEVFDKLLLLVDGKLIYQGNARDSINYFDSFGFPVPKQTNPTDFYMELMYNPTKEKTKAAQINQMIEHYDQHLSDKFVQEINQIKVVDINHHVKNYVASVPKQAYFLLGRTFKNFVRIKGNVVGRIMANFILGIIYCLLYGRISDDMTEPTSYTDRMGALYSIALGQMMSTMTTTLAAFSLERNVFMKEYRAGTYYIMPYIMSKLIIELTFILFVTICFVTVVYFVLGFYKSFMAWLFFILIVGMLTISGNAFGTMSACLVPDTKLATVFSMLMLLPFMVFSGFYVNNSQLPVWTRWIQYISPIKYALEGILINEFSRLDNLNDTLNPIVNLDLKIEQGWAILALGIFYIVCLVLSVLFLKIVSMRTSIQ